MEVKRKDGGSERRGQSDERSETASGDAASSVEP